MILVNKLGKWLAGIGNELVVTAAVIILWHCGIIIWKNVCKKEK